MPLLSLAVIGLASFLLPPVSAHGFVRTITVDGVAFQGLFPNAKASTLPNNSIRQITDPSPVKGALNAAVNCGNGAKAATSVLDVLPGSKLQFTWSGWDGSNWPHNTGPILTYLANCGSVTCDKFDSTTAKWFKIAQLGRKAPGQPWIQADIMSGLPSNSAIPTTLAPGNYLIRHEIIALHLANSLGGAEFYPSCTQLRVGGEEKGVPDARDLVSLPGAYADDDPGIWVPDIFESDEIYTFPGPAVANLSGTSATTSSSLSTTTTKMTTSAKQSSSSSTKTTTSLKQTSSTSTTKTSSTSAKQTSSSSSKTTLTAKTSSTKVSSSTAKSSTTSATASTTMTTSSTTTTSSITPTVTSTKGVNPVIFCDQIEGRDEDEYEWDGDDEEEESITVPTEEPSEHKHLESDVAFLARQWKLTLARRRDEFGWVKQVVPRKRRYMHRIMTGYRSL